MTAISESGPSGFPPGYFLITSTATGRVLDVGGQAIDDGAELILWPSKEVSLVQSRRSPEADNQVFFVDDSGALCSRSSGHAIDIDHDRLVLRHRKPASFAHPFPKFSYHQELGEINVKFDGDPTRNMYILTSVPLRKPKSFIDDASQFLTTNIRTPFASLFGGVDTNSTPEQMTSAGVDLAEDEVLEEERGEEGEIDDSPDEKREIHMLTIPHQRPWNLAEKAKLRRRFEIIPLRTASKRTTGITV
ncbi:hypothetical protein D9757_010831 [Collybiopsis confluens]|uniref:Uncharacterized protein n=1 Tax=Collybiopsis confluens TaxID=2823264 RepID=A0A8H5GLN0_9AGAR|nr:hypothetical protein D9757_010831 [Collybiopsis confluens]